MFSTIKYDHADSEKRLVDIGYSIRRSQHSACRACHSKKVKCSGQKSGCDRCRSKATACIYAKPKRRTKQPNSSDEFAKCLPAQTPGCLALGSGCKEVGIKSSNSIGLEETTFRADEVLIPPSPLHEVLEPTPKRQHAEALKYLGGDAAFGELWDPYASSVFEDGSDYVVQCETSDSTDSVRPPSLSSNPKGLEEYVSFDHDAGPTSSFSLGEYTSSDSSNPESLTTSADTSDWTSLSSVSLCRNHYLHSAASSIMWHSESSPEESLEPLGNQEPGLSGPKTSDAVAPISCQCMQTALQILEVLETDNNKFNSSGFDHILAVKKNAIARCTTILDCHTCSAASAFVMLLIVICKKILISYEAWSSRYHGRKQVSSEVLVPGESKANSKVNKFFLGVYEVDSEDEQCSLLRSLAMVQLRHLRRLMNKIKRLASSRSWAAHQAVSASFLLRLEQAAAGLVAWEFVGRGKT